MASASQKTSVVIVGGGLVGLSAAMLLAWHDVPCILLEKHTKPSLHPRAVGYTPRTMEIFDTVGIADRIPQVEEGFKLRRVKVESMAGKWHDDAMPWKPTVNGHKVEKETPPQHTPWMGAALAQDRLEPILREKAINLGADIRMGARMTEFNQNDDSVTVSVTDAEGERYQVHAPFMIAADGHRSIVRESLGISTTGRGHLNSVRSVLFRASLNECMKSYQQFVIRQEGLQAFLTTYGDDRWVLMFTDDIERDSNELDAAIRQAVGVPDLKFEIITTGRWELKAKIANTFQVGRVFIAGDAAHTLPPTRGGYGANTGIHDVHNLAWKLAGVLKSAYRPELLDTYSTERHPVAWLRHQQTFARPDYAQHRQPSDDLTDIYEDSAVELGQIYVSSAIVDDEEDNPIEPLARPPDQWKGRPGTRASYRLLKTHGDEELSSLHLFGRHWVLITEDGRWEDKVKKISGECKLSLKCAVINGNGGYTDDGSFCQALGLGQDGASLVRPDGHVAWRCKAWSADGESSLRDFITSAAGE